MKKAAIVGERKAALVDAPDPRPVADWALVKVHVAPMCTEYKSFVKGQCMSSMGHEAVGEVVEVAQPCCVKPGDRVVVQPQYPCGRCRLCVSGDYIRCDHPYDFVQFTGQQEGRATMAQYMLKPSWLLSPIPDDVSYERAALAICALGPSFGAWELMGVSAFDTVLITGAGPVGLGGVVNAKFRGAKVIVVESIPYRVEKARELGADLVLDPGDENILDKIKDFTDGEGVSYALDCAGVVPAQKLCLAATRKKGMVTIVALSMDDLPIKGTPDLVRTGVMLAGSWHYNLNDYPKVMQVIRESPVAEKLISHVFPMSEIQKAFETSASHESAKILLKPWE